MPPFSDFTNATSSSGRDVEIIAWIEQHYGSRLERMSDCNKLALRSVITSYLYLRQVVENFTIDHAICESIPITEKSIHQEMLQFEGISTTLGEKLIKIVTDQQLSIDVTD